MKEFWKNRLPKRGYGNLLWFFMGLALLVMILVFGIIYIWYYQKSMQEMTEKNSLVVQVAEKDIDGQILGMARITQSLWQDYDLLVALTNDSHYHTYKLSQRLSSFTVIHENILDIAVFDLYSDYVYCSTGAIEREEYFSKYTNLGQDPVELLEMVQGASSPAFYGFLPTQLVRWQGEYQSALYIDPISATRKVVYVVDQQSFISPVQNILQEQEGILYILDGSGSPVLSLGINRDDPDWASLASLNLPAFPPGGGEVKSAMRDGNLYLSTQSNVSQFRYVIQAHQSVFLGGLRILRIVFFLSILFLILLGVAMSSVFSRISYAPIRRLQEAVLKPDEHTPSTGWEDLDSITSHLRAIQEHLEESQRRLETDHEFLYNSLIVSLINSTSAYYFNQEAYRQAGIDLTKRWSQVALLRAEEAALEQIKEAALTLAREQGIGCYLSDKNEYERLIIVLHGEDKLALVKLFNALSGYLEAEGISFQMGVGLAVEEVHLIRLSFSQAFSTLRESGGQPVTFYRGALESATKSRFQSSRPQLTQAILSGDMETVEALVRDLFSKTDDHANHAFLFSDIIYFLLVTARAENAPDTYISNALYSVHKDPDGMIDSLLYLSRNLCQSLAEREPAQQADPFLQQIMEYIRQHYTDNSLSAAHIAEHFNVSTSHLNRYVKGASDKTVFAILDSMRMEHAMQLIVDTDLSIREIVDRSGYGDVNYFTKKFKRTTGLTPGQYRRVQQEG